MKWFHNKSFLIKIVNDTPDDGNDSKEIDVVEEVKGHFEKHKYIYIGVGVAVLVGVTWYITRRKVAPYLIPSTNGGLKATQFPTVTIAPVFNTDVSTTVNLGGYTAKIVKRMSDGEMWGTITEAAEAAGSSVSLMSRHLNGHKPNVYGEIYKIVGLGTLK